MCRCVVVAVRSESRRQSPDGIIIYYILYRVALVLLYQIMAIIFGHFIIKLYDLQTRL